MASMRLREDVEGSLGVVWEMLTLAEFAMQN